MAGEIRMNWNAILAIAEAVGVIVIVISMQYLALHIQLATLATADTSRTARATDVRENNLNPAE
jgi:uncharacterized membrane protein